jgi:ribosomal protein S18 acetylase RimI-like enzyme
MRFSACSSEQSLELLASLAHRIWNDYYPPIIGQAQVDYMLNAFYSYAALQEQIKEGQQFFIIEEEQQAIGFFSVSTKSEQEVFINKFYIQTMLHGKGYGAKVMGEIKEKYKGSRLTLTVNRQNYKAINFYFKEGFRIKEVADFDIGNGYVMNDFVMVFEPLNE